DKSRPIHLVCRYSTPEIIKYVINKNVNLECMDNRGWKPIHYICRYSTLEMIKYIINKKVDLKKACVADYKGKYGKSGCIELIESNDNLTNDEKKIIEEIKYYIEHSSIKKAKAKEYN